MKNYVVTNAYLKTKPFLKLKSALEEAFEALGEPAVFLTNDEAFSLLKKEGNGAPVLFFDKDTILCEMLEKRGYRSINSSNTIEICDDKAKTFVALNGKVPMPETIVAPFTYANVGYTDFNFLSRVEALGYPLIVKESKGSFGCGVHLASDRDQLMEIVKGSHGAPLIFQRYIAESRGRDLRVYVVGGKAVAAAERINERDFRSNVTGGGRMKAISIADDFYSKHIRLAERAANGVHADFAGVDILFSNDGPLVCEINSNAHFSALTEATGIDVAKAIAGYYLSVKG